MLTRNIFIEFPEETEGRDENCLLRSLSTQQEDESQNNVPRDKAVQYCVISARCNDWEEGFCPFVALYIMKINVRFHIHTRDDYKMWACIGENRVYGGKC
jgi:hypothetical protein